MTKSRAKAEVAPSLVELTGEDEIAYLAKRHKVTPAIVREIIRRSGSSERASIEREIEKGKARR